MFCKKQKQRNVTSYNLVFENGAKHWFPFKDMPAIGTKILIKPNGVQYASECDGEWIVTKIDYEICTTEQWSEISNYIFIHVKRPQVRTDT